MLEKLPSVDFLNSIVPISRFNNGEASLIFSEVKDAGCKVVTSNDTPACILIEPELYKEIVEMLNKPPALHEVERKTKPKLIKRDNQVITYELLDVLGITEDELDKLEVEIS